MIKNIVDKIINEKYEINYDEALRLINKELDQVLNGADDIRQAFDGQHVELCSIINAKCGKCSEDCKFCAQSVHYNTQINAYPLMGYDKVCHMALENEREGVHRYSIVTSGRGLKGKEFESVLSIYRKLKKDTNISLCASLGIINERQLIKLKESGVNRYHHNLETSREYYSKICSTHSYDERIETIKTAKKVGLDVCCGGIIGMGETMEDRIKLAFEIKDLGIKSIPINILMPIKGTPMEDVEPIKEEDILRTLAIFKFINPKASIRLAGGRTHLKNNGERAFLSGVSSTITGNYLTTSGNGIKEDIKLIKKIRK